MEIQKYEDWMRPQIVALFNLEYGSDLQAFDEFFERFYEHPFQQKQGIRIVAVDGDKVAGFQSFFYWPMMRNGKKMHSFQSGNSLVHPDYRGKGLFGKMLNYIHLPESGMAHDLLIGFPVEASYPAFMKNKWLNPFDLQWYVRTLNPAISLLTNPETSLEKGLGKPVAANAQSDDNLAYVAQTTDYDSYRFGYQKGDYYRYTYKNGNDEVFFELKAQRRKKVIKEIVVGKIIPSRLDSTLVNRALKELVKVVKKKSSFTIMSIAINSLSEELKDAVTSNGFKKIDKKIYFIDKGNVVNDTTDWSKWWNFRPDIDTW